MTERNRNIIIGGVFLAAVLVIFVPMMFERPLDLHVDIEVPESVDLDSNIPPIETPNMQEVIGAKEEINRLVDEEGFLRESGNRVGEPKLFFNAEDAEQWAVQLASFGNRDAAEKLRLSLESDGIEVWLSTAMVDQTTVHRVVMGPYIVRSDADDKVTDMTRDYDLEPIVVGFSY